MKGLHFVLLFTAMTFIAWGTYGPVLRHGTHALDDDALRAFVGVGLAYFLIAVLIPVVILKKNKESGTWTTSGIVYSIVAGTVGALGALGIILALAKGGEPVYVMPIVFGFAPVVNTLVTAWIGKTFGQIRPIFIGGIATAALGAVGVLFYSQMKPPAKTTSPEATPTVYRSVVGQPEKVALQAAVVEQPAPQEPAPQEPTPAAEPKPQEPAPAEPKPQEPAPQSEPKPQEAKPEESPKPQSQESTSTAKDATPADKPATNPTDAAKPESEKANAASSDAPKSLQVEKAIVENETSKVGDESVESKSAQSQPADTKSQVVEKEPAATGKTKDVTAIVLSIIMAAVCWGSYGPMLHIGQSKMSGSRLRPFICVGIAYFLIAVLVPLLLIYGQAGNLGSWTFAGLTWSFFAGVAGAVGALGVILAFNAGGKPIYVMPLVFGFAPVINTFITLSEKNAWNRVPLMFWISLAVVIAGAVTVLVTAPKAKPKPGH